MNVKKMSTEELVRVLDDLNRRINEAEELAEETEDPMNLQEAAELRDEYRIVSAELQLRNG